MNVADLIICGLFDSRLFTALFAFLLLVMDEQEKPTHSFMAAENDII